MCYFHRQEENVRLKRKLDVRAINAKFTDRSTSTFSERELAICCGPSVCLSSVTLVRPTQAVQIVGNISTAFGILAIH